MKVDASDAAGRTEQADTSGSCGSLNHTSPSDHNVIGIGRERRYS